MLSEGIPRPIKEGAETFNESLPFNDTTVNFEQENVLFPAHAGVILSECGVQ